jgi:hypothetical protein
MNNHKDVQNPALTSLGYSRLCHRTKAKIIPKIRWDCLVERVECVEDGRLFLD